MSTQHPDEWSSTPSNWPGESTTVPAGTFTPTGVTIACGDPPSSCTCPVNGWWGTVPPPPCPVHGPFTPMWPVAPAYPTWPGDAPAAPGWGYSTTLSSLLKPAPALSDADVERIAKRTVELLCGKPGTIPGLYHCKHAVEAYRWHDTNENREAFAAWFDVHDQMFETRGPVIVLPEGGEAQEGEWVLWSDGEFLVMDDDSFTSNYEAA